MRPSIDETTTARGNTSMIDRAETRALEDDEASPIPSKFTASLYSGAPGRPLPRPALRTSAATAQSAGLAQPHRRCGAVHRTERFEHVAPRARGQRDRVRPALERDDHQDALPAAGHDG